MEHSDQPTEPFPAPEPKPVPIPPPPVKPVPIPPVGANPEPRKREAHQPYAPRASEPQVLKSEEPKKREKNPYMLKSHALSWILLVFLLSAAFGTVSGYFLFHEKETTPSEQKTKKERLLSDALKLVGDGEYTKAISEVSRYTSLKKQVNTAISERASGKALGYLGKGELDKAEYFIKQAERYKSTTLSNRAQNILAEQRKQSEEKASLKQAPVQTTPSTPATPQAPTQTVPETLAPKKEPKQPKDEKTSPKEPKTDTPIQTTPQVQPQE